MSDDFLKFLYGESQEQDALEGDLTHLFEALAGVEQLEVNAAPLKKALKQVGVEDGEVVEAEGGVLTLQFTEMQPFLDAVAKLTDVNKLNELAGLGWVAVAEGDVASQAEPCAQYRINFLSVQPIEPSDVMPKTGERPEKAADAMNEPGTADLTDRDDRQRGLPKGTGKDAAQF
jgi:hypothetical protein